MGKKGASVASNIVGEIHAGKLDGHEGRSGLLGTASMTGNQAELDGAVKRSRMQRVSRLAPLDDGL